MHEDHLQENLSEKFREFLLNNKESKNRTNKFQSRAPEILQSVVRKADRIRTQSGREIKPRHIDVEIREAGDGCFIIRLQFFTETRIWKEEIED